MIMTWSGALVSCFSVVVQIFIDLNLAPNQISVVELNYISVHLKSVSADRNTNKKHLLITNKENRANGTSCARLREKVSTVVCEHYGWRDVWWWWCSCRAYSGLTTVVIAGQVLSAVTVKLSHTNWYHMVSQWLTVCDNVRVCTDRESDALSEWQLISSSHTLVRLICVSASMCIDIWMVGCWY